MSQERTRFFVAAAAAVLAVVIGGVLGLRAWREPRVAPPPRPRGEATGEVADWCPDGYEAITGGCFAAARGPSATPKGLVVYLHGRHAPEQVPEERERQTRVAELGTKRGYAVLALRGAQGECLDPRLATWWCWPSSERNVDDGPRFAAGLRAAIALAAERARAPRTVLLGFSNGGYFAAMIARSELLSFDAIAIAHAGPVEPMKPTGKAPPILLIDADDDPSGPEMDRLEADLTRESWPHAMVAREGGHQLPAWDVEMALTFFDRVATERLPLSPPLSARARRLHAPVGADTAVGEPESAPAGASAGGASTTTTATASTAQPTSVPQPTSTTEPPTGTSEAPETPAPSPSE
ncbi:MAG: hypothetical protein JWP97_5734 [Labilithrix sp.]|nr:hypothetical protein [Labilithrix sp.]